MLPSLFNQIYLFDLINIKYNKTKLLIPHLENIDKIKFFEQDIFNVNKKYFNFLTL